MLIYIVKRYFPVELVHDSSPMHIGQPKAPMFKHLQLFSKGHGLGMEVYHHLQKTPQTCPADLPIRGTKYRKVLHISVESNWSIVQSIIGAFML